MPTHTFNCRLYYALGLSEVTGVRAVEFPDLAATAVPADALTDLGKITVPGKVALDDITVTALWDGGWVAALYDPYFRQTTQWRAVFPDGGSYWNWFGYIRSWAYPDMADDAVLEFKFQIRPITIPTFVPAA